VKAQILSSVNGHRTIDHVLAGLDRRQMLQLMAMIAEQQATLAMMKTLLEARLTQTPAPSIERYLTVEQAAKVLRLKRGTVYDLVRQQRLPKRPGLGKAVRIPSSALVNGANVGG
jgi:excisionase family DNA binding protein